MALEDLVGPDKFLDALVITNPEGGDPKSQGDDHLRGIKNTLRNTFPNLTGAVTATHEELNDAVAAFLAGTFPVGGIIPWGALAAPAGNWALCDGKAVSRTTYAELFALYGTTWGGGDGSTTFNIPDLRDAFLIGAGSSYALAATGGGTAVALALANMPGHRHQTLTNETINGGGAPSGATQGAVAGSGFASSDYLTRSSSAEASVARSSAAIGGKADGAPGDAFSILNPYVGMNWALHLGVPAT